MNKRPCKYCGKQFTPVTEWQEYDKDSCRVADFRKREKERREADAAELERLRQQQQQRER